MSTREQWLLNAIQALKPDFQAVGADFPDLRVSVSWPGGRSNRLKTIGQYWPGAASKDGRPCVFISPLLGDLDALDTLHHELVHAATPGAKHGPVFKRLAAKLGREGKATADHAGPVLKARLQRLNAELGAYPHAEMIPGNSGIKKQSTRLLKAECACGYCVRVTKKWADIALPICPLCETAMVVQGAA